MWGAGTMTLALVARPHGLRGATNEAAAEIARFTGGVAVETGKIAIEISEIVENGNSVPLAVAVDSPMTSDDHVTEIVVIAEANPQPRVATFHLTPMSGRAEAATRVRLAATQTVIVIARTSQGKVYTERKAVKVSIGGCGG